MTTITVAAYNRPQYLRTVLVSLLEALAYHTPEDLQHVIVGIDPGGAYEQDVRATVLQFADVLTLSHRRIRAHIIVWPEHMGVSEHPRRLLQHVFAVMQSAGNLHLEDDTVLSQDALALTDWYYRTGAHASGAVCLCLHSRSTEFTKYDHTEIRYRPDFGVWGWATTYTNWWLWFSHYWNCKRDGKLGFDWSASWMMSKHSLWALAPALSRVRNIGRIDSTHGTPEDWDEDMYGLAAAGAEHAVRYGPDAYVLSAAGKPAHPTWTWGD